MVEVHLGSEATISAPFAGEVAATAAGLSVRSRDRCVLLAGELAGVRPGPVAEGDAVASARGPLTVWAVEAGDGEECPADPPTFVRASDFEAHAAVFRDPSALLGIPEGRRYRRRDPVDLLERRDRALGLLQAHYYERPPEIERGWREHLIDVDGRHYLDMVNNVTILGHGHPAIAAAASRQWGMLNTNSRFHYEAVVELAERLLATVTPPLDTVFLVNSGSEAVDLALRLGAAFTGRRDVLCVEESYHGWTLASDAVSTAVSDNPMAQETRPGWVHALDAPNSYRGRHRGDDAGAAYAHDAEATIAGLERAGTPIGTFIAEPRNGNAGAIGLPAGYLTRVAAAVRGQGGVCLSDEVQVGYGRQGDWFWGYEEHGVVPDILTVAKAMGDGHPLGAVITTRAIAESLAPKGTFFSSAGGSTLSARIGLAVLDIMEAEGLQENARRTGALLSELLAELAERQPLIGAVHGRGLYQGVELVRDRDTLEPADTETAWVCDRMLGLGVIEQPTGDRGNILKVKPPLCITPESARFYVAALDRALRECTSRIR
jgi:4-aminobutyrate aminotransferase-like enzyme